MYADDVKKTTLTGVVERSKLGGVSKNAHTGFVLLTKADQVKLRREGGNPFYDPFFEKFENSEITVEGFDMDQYFLVTAVKQSRQGRSKK